MTIENIKAAAEEKYPNWKSEHQEQNAINAWCREAFCKGAEHVLTNLWHPATEMPEHFKAVLCEVIVYGEGYQAGAYTIGWHNTGGDWGYERNMAPDVSDIQLVRWMYIPE